MKMNIYFSVHDLPARQAGSALLLILVLLMIGSLVGLSIAQSTITDERISGNYRAVVQADMAAQSGAIATLSALRKSADTQRISISDLFTNITKQDKDDLLYLNEDEVTDVKNLTGAALWSVLSARRAPVPGMDNQTEYVYGFYEDKDSENRDIIVMVVQARHIGVVSQDGDDPSYTYSQPVFITLAADPRDTGSGGGGNDGSENSSALTYADIFPSPVAACEGVAVGSGSTVAYFNSEEGVWTGSAPPTDEVVISSLTNENANIRLHGNENIYGSIKAIGQVKMTGSSKVFGNVQANDSIDLDGNVVIHLDAVSGNNVVFSSSGTVHGNVVAQNNVDFRNWSAKVGGFVKAGGSISITGNSPVCNNAISCTPNDSSLRVPLIPALNPDDCAVSVFGNGKDLEEVAGYLKSELISHGSLNLNNNDTLNAVFSSVDIKNYRRNGQVKEVIYPQRIEFVGEEVGFYRFDSLEVGSDGGLEVPANAGRVFVFVDGNLKFGGGGKGLVIGENSSLTFIVGGKTEIGSVVQMKKPNKNPPQPIDTLTNDGHPVLNIFSYYDQYSGSYTQSSDSKANVAVTLNGSSFVVANIYAPYGNVYVGNGTYLYGAAFGKSVATSGNGHIIFDKAILEAEFGSGGSGGNPGNGDTGGGNKAITNWR